MEEQNKKCPICGDLYTYLDPKVEYHVQYHYNYPEITTSTCRGCNYAEYLIRHTEVKSRYNMERKKAKVKKWTLKNRQFIL